MQTQEEILGSTLKYLRKQKGLTQIELSNGLCTQAQISRIESGLMIPNAILCYQFIKKLGISLDYFFSLIENERSDYILDFRQQAGDMVRARDYEGLYELVTGEMTNPIFKSSYDKQFLYWHMGIAEFHFNNNYQTGIDYVKKALTQIVEEHQVHHYTAQEINILHSIGVFEHLLENHDRAIYWLRKAITIQEQYIAEPNTRMLTRIYFTLSQALTKSSRYRDSLEAINQGIDSSLKNKTFSLLGELYHQKGFTYIFLNEEDRALTYLYKAIQLFEATDQSYMSIYPREVIEEYKLE
ncbi:helix-turn-helix domain-containing protein [Salisediminibacterium halotolerans]|uniref:helix-turn-helix domain-containing protein n=1 Tax=Salisediminibacterium halotolerans TaxID=517425 RepID=UPI000EAE04F3|nr:helix-turn-helix domain-containing protein [Salisediminibacterium halotolerans]RLJ71670.1 Xre family transcriptional regulator [Actinophytocola xinjiangensis]RPE86820.1 Xre family transcriptional regulator [Salisediminibacterium halotolerans]TWG32883.1 Xre family transcriptional regulator [Salisediminibacterium halotolerans]GEL06975.1 transcriptional regulator [Salisediminibacterium halotolerans]